MLSTNEYFEGKVISIGFNSASGAVTSGVMAPGEYTFSTDKEELVTVVFGSMQVKLPGEDLFKKYEKYSTFKVAAKKSFDLIIEETVAYTCEYKS